MSTYLTTAPAQRIDDLNHATQNAHKARAALCVVIAKCNTLVGAPPVADDWDSAFDDIGHIARANPALGELVASYAANVRHAESAQNEAQCVLAPWIICSDFDFGIGGRDAYVDTCYTAYCNSRAARGLVALSRDLFEDR